MSPVVYFKGQRYDRIRKQLEEQKGLFVDSVFPATSAALGGAVDSLTEAEHVEWKRPREICDDPRLMPQGGDCNLAISGGKLVSSWFLQALQVLAGIKELVYKVIKNSSEQEFKSDSYFGLLRFRFWRFGEWVEVVVDDTIPCVAGRPLFTHYSKPAIFWPCLLEKAYAKLLGSYGALDEGHISDALVDMTGGVTEIIDLKARDVVSSEDDRAALFKQLQQEMLLHSIICSSIPATKGEDTGEKIREGITLGNIYHVTSLKKVHIQDINLKNLFKGREKLAVVRVRNTGSLREDASEESAIVGSPTRSEPDSSPEDDIANSSSLSPTKITSRKAAWTRLKEKDHSRLGLTIDAEGESWVPFEDFCRYFHELTIVRLYNYNLFTKGPTWQDSYHRASWIPGERSGGGNSNSPSFFHNPQFLFDVKSDEEELVIQLLQHGGIEPASAGSGSAVHRLLAVGMTIFQVESNREYRLHKQWGFTPKALTVDHQRRRELSYRGSIVRGRYLLIPSAFRPGSEGSFLVRLVSRSNLKLRPLVRDIPHEPCGLSCIASPVLWVTVLTVKSISGLQELKDVFCTVKCEKETVRTELGQVNKGEVTWRDAFVFFRRKPERLISVTVYSHNTLKRNQFLGTVELQASVSHAPSTFEVTLLDKQGGVLMDRRLSVEILTEDDLLAV